MSILVRCSEQGSSLFLGQAVSLGQYGNFGGGGTQIAEAGNEIIESFSSPKGNGTKFADLREAFFDSRRDLLFRYAIFGHQTNYRQATDDCTSGEANYDPWQRVYRDPRG